VTSVTVDFRRLYWLDSFSAAVYSIDKKRGRDMIQLSIRKPLTHILAYSEGIQTLPGLYAYHLYRRTSRYETRGVVTALKPE